MKVCMNFKFKFTWSCMSVECLLAKGAGQLLVQHPASLD